MLRLQGKQLRSGRGQGQLAELGPVLFIFFLIFFFPMVNLMSLGAVFASGWLLNYSQAREAALIYRQGGANISTPDPTNPNVQKPDPKKVAKVIDERVNKKWFDSGIGRFVKVENDQITTEVIPIRVQIGARFVEDRLIRVNTSFRARPFLTIPFPTPVPGLNAPYPMSFSSENTTE